MRNLVSFCIFIFVAPAIFGQFSTDKLQVSLGYNVHNAYAKRFNHLVDDFNNSRYPLEISENMNNINWMHGMEGAVHYRFTDDIRFHGILKSRRQFLEAPYSQRPEFRQFLFRVHTVALGADMRLSEEGRFSHWVGGDLLVGVMGVFTNWTSKQGYHGSREMVNIDHTAVLGLGVAYEAQFKLHDLVSLYIRPVVQFALNSQVRKLTDFFAPAFDSEGLPYFEEGLDAKYDSGNLNGIGISGGVVVSLPEL